MRPSKRDGRCSATPAAGSGCSSRRPRPGRTRRPRFTQTQERMVAHNDGFGFGDFGPDYLFLWCGRPDAGGEGESFLIDGAKLLDLMAADPDYAEVAAFC